MEKVRIGVIGLGNMGSWHAANMVYVEHATLTAVCDIDPFKGAKFSEKLKVPAFETHQELLASKRCDAIVVAVPHYDHMGIAMDAFAQGVSVLVEKPIAVSVTAARQGVEAYRAAVRRHPQLKFGIMFNQRSNPMYQKLRELVQAGELGEISRVTWLITNWFRSWAYYASGGWRATWQGEGGGVLINQCPHQLDLIQWVINGLMPKRVTAVGFVGKTHPIEVEDEVSAIFEYPNGAIGHFVTSTGEFPGTNRLEICGSRGKLIAENNKLTFWRTRTDVQEVNRTTPDSFPNMDLWQIDVPFTPRNVPEHQFIMQDFVNVVREDKLNEQLLAPGTDGISGLEIGNAIMMSGLTRRPVEVPVDGAAYDQFLRDMARQYGGKKTLQTVQARADMAGSFGR